MLKKLVSLSLSIFWPVARMYMAYHMPIRDSCGFSRLSSVAMFGRREFLKSFIFPSDYETSAL